MRILCCLNRDLASSVVLNLLLPVLSRHDVRVGLTERVGKAPSLGPEHPERRELRIAEQTFPNDVFFPLVERAGLPDNGTRYLTFAEVGRYRNIGVVPLGDPNAPDGLRMVRDFAPDLILTIRYGAILKSAVISIPKLGVLNLHSGLLPQYRGVLATFRAIASGDAQIGCTLHYISDGTIDTGAIDTGAIIGTAATPVMPGRSLLWHILALYPPGVGLIADALAAMSSGAPLIAATQSPNDGAYFSQPSNADWERFTRRGWRSADPGDLDTVLRRYLP
jgi:methionyl-tRNA formyltransferase